MSRLAGRVRRPLFRTSTTRRARRPRPAVVHTRIRSARSRMRASRRPSSRTVLVGGPGQSGRNGCEVCMDGYRVPAILGIQYPTRRTDDEMACIDNATSGEGSEAHAAHTPESLPGNPPQQRRPPPNHAEFRSRGNARRVHGRAEATGARDGLGARKRFGHAEEAAPCPGGVAATEGVPARRGETSRPRRVRGRGERVPKNSMRDNCCYRASNFGDSSMDPEASRCA